MIGQYSPPPLKSNALMPASNYFFLALLTSILPNDFATPLTRALEFRFCLSFSTCRMVVKRSGDTKSPNSVDRHFLSSAVTTEDSGFARTGLFIWLAKPTWGAEPLKLLLSLSLLSLFLLFWDILADDSRRLYQKKKVMLCSLLGWFKLRNKLFMHLYTS